jgi:hypothetical protein
MEDDAANFDPAGLLIGHAFEGEFLYLRFRGARDVSYPGGSLAPQITKELYALHWHWSGEIVGHWDGPIRVASRPLTRLASEGRPMHSQRPPP